jgi:hypothetical protein
LSPIELARQMRKRGWCYSRRRRGQATFGVRFPNGKGVTRVLELGLVSRLEISAAQLADYLSAEAASSVRYDARTLVP